MTERLTVDIDQKRLGSITLDGRNDQYGLVYDPKWMEIAGFAISPHLKPGACASGSVKRFLSNLLPEGKWLDLPPTYKDERPFGNLDEGSKIRTGASLPALFAACNLCRIPALAIRTC